MGKRMTVNRAAYRRILAASPLLLADVRQRTKAVADACNASSSWGGYYWQVRTTPTRVVGNVWSIGRSDRPGGDRALRMVRKIDAGR